MIPFSFSERDLDLIQLEELHAESRYSEWFAKKIGLSGYNFIHAHHSVSATVNGSNGESDILAFYQKSGFKVAVLIEDKICADFTDRQVERYVERGKDLVESGKAKDFRTVLVAPNQYLIKVPKADPWHERITVEDIALWFKAQTGHHFRWRFDALTDALKSISNPSPSTADAARFSLNFSQYLKINHETKFSHNPGKDPAGPTIHFPGSSGKLMLWWKVGCNQITLQLMDEFQGLAENLGDYPRE